MCSISYRVTQFPVAHSNPANISKHVLPVFSTLPGEFSVTVGVAEVQTLDQVLKIKVHPYTSVSLEPLLLPQSVSVRVLHRNRANKSNIIYIQKGFVRVAYRLCSE